MYFDPHATQMALGISKQDLINDKNNESLVTFYTDLVREIALVNIDPSLVLGFAFKNLDEFKDFCDEIESSEKDEFKIELVNQDVILDENLELEELSDGELLG